MLPTYPAQRILGADRRGSSWPVLIETAAGTYLTKLRGAAQGPLALAAEVIVAGLAERLDLQIPARILVDLPEVSPSPDRDQELTDLLQASRGINLGFQLLAQAHPFRIDDAPRLDRRTAAAILWLDGLVLNPDRTQANPNLLWSRGSLWLIDHGASLGFQYDWPGLTEATPRRPFAPGAAHLLREWWPVASEYDAEFASALNRAALERIVAEVPASFLEPRSDPGGGGFDLERRRVAYVAFLWKRLRAPRPFLPTTQPDSPP